jgi:hypothetical protein
VGQVAAGVAKGRIGSTAFLEEATVEANALDDSSRERLADYIEEQPLWPFLLGE